MDGRKTQGHQSAVDRILDYIDDKVRKQNVARRHAGYVLEARRRARLFAKQVLPTGDLKGSLVG